MAAGGFKQRLVELAHALGVAIHRFLSPNPYGFVQLSLSHPDLLRVARELLSDIPQASSHDETVTICQSGNWRAYFSAKLTGSGLEMGALHKPMPTRPDMQVRYVDCLTHEEQLREYGTLHPDWLKRIVRPDIIDDAGTLATIGDASADFAIAAHLIEHMPNPIAAVNAWCRVVRPGGHLYLIVPDKRSSFDRRRVRTTIEHLILDYQRPSAERDFDHFVDYAVHVLRASREGAIAEADRLQREGTSIHYHVFQPADIVALLKWFAGQVRPIEILEGPIVDPYADEFHLLIRVGQPAAS